MTSPGNPPSQNTDPLSWCPAEENKDALELMRNLLDTEHKLMLAAGGVAAVHRLTGRLQQVALLGPTDYVGEDCLLTGGQLLSALCLKLPHLVLCGSSRQTRPSCLPSCTS